MNTRIFSVVLAATLVTVSSGCGSMRNFLFGRGARCGSCSTSNVVMPSTPQVPPQSYVSTPAPYQSQPYQPQPCQTTPCQSPTAYPYQAAPQSPPRRCFLRNWFGRNRNVSPPPCETSAGCQPMAPCYSCYGSEVMGDCGCGGTSVVTDPYLVQPGQINDGGTIIQEDDFRARRFDSDGARIIWEQPATEL